MDIDKVRQILDGMPVKSDYEFKHFEIEVQGSWHRQMRYALRLKEELHDRLQEAAAEAELAETAIDRVDKDHAKHERDARRRILQSNLSRINRHVDDLEKELAQVDRWLDGHKPEECQDAANTFEQSESEHWTEQLGRELGVELLSDMKSSKGSMSKMSMLPLADYKKAVLITNQFATFMKKTAEQVESMLMPNKPSELPTTTSPAPAKAQEEKSAETKGKSEPDKKAKKTKQQ
jgi:hypothetical protein